MFLCQFMSTFKDRKKATDTVFWCSFQLICTCGNLYFQAKSCTARGKNSTTHKPQECDTREPESNLTVISWQWFYWICTLFKPTSLQWKVLQCIFRLCIQKSQSHSNVLGSHRCQWRGRDREEISYSFGASVWDTMISVHTTSTKHGTTRPPAPEARALCTAPAHRIREVCAACAGIATAPCSAVVRGSHGFWTCTPTLILSPLTVLKQLYLACRQIPLVFSFPHSNVQGNFIFLGHLSIPLMN